MSAGLGRPGLRWRLGRSALLHPEAQFLLRLAGTARRVGPQRQPAGCQDRTNNDQRTLSCAGRELQRTRRLLTRCQHLALTVPLERATHPVCPSTGGSRALLCGYIGR